MYIDSSSRSGSESSSTETVKSVVKSVRSEHKPM